MLQCSKTRISVFDSGQVVLHQSWAPDWREWKWLLLWSTCWLVSVLSFRWSNTNAPSLTGVRVRHNPSVPSQGSVCAMTWCLCVGLVAVRREVLSLLFQRDFFSNLLTVISVFLIRCHLSLVREVSIPFLLELADSRAAAVWLHFLEHTTRCLGWDWLSA